MKIAPLADVKARLSAYVEQVEAEGPVIITRNGRPVAVLLAPRDEEDLRRLVLTHSPRFQAALEKSRASIRADQGLARNTFWKAVAERRRKGG
jgi:prevent-host-death family protein